MCLPSAACPSRPSFKHVFLGVDVTKRYRWGGSLRQGNNAIQSLDDRVTAELASKLDSRAPAIAPLATAAALATTDGQVAAHGSSVALQSSLTTGLSNKADQSAFDVLEGVVATKSTPDSVDLKLSNYSTRRP